VKLRIWDLNPVGYARHPIHRDERVWPESNCSVDLWVELLHAFGVEPLAGLAFTIGMDLEGDQWTFVKFPPSDLYALYGIEIIELNVWRSLAAHAAEQLALGRPVIVEVDAFYLPDTAGTSYRTQHTKTSIAIQAMNHDLRRLGYFHNAGYFELAGDDYIGILRLEAPGTDADRLAPYAEVAKLGARAPRAGRELLAASLALLREHLRRRPRENPFRRFATRFPEDLAWVAAGTLPTFHAYAFATLRQCGASFELAATYLRWLEAQGEDPLKSAADAFDHIASSAKDLQFKTARVANGRPPFDPAPTIGSMADAWDESMAELTARYDPCPGP
jgi:hypothetical protein